jgi:hypothetical protein
MTTAREHDGEDETGRQLTGGQAVGTLTLLKQIALTERSMVRTQNSADRRMMVQEACGVSEARARRLIKSVGHLWKLRAVAFGTPSKARARLLPLAEAIYSMALGKGNLNAALGAVKLQAELCGLRGPDVASLPDGDTMRGPIAPETADVAQRVLDRLLAYGAHGSNGHGGNGHKGNGRAQA